ncbi:MULTISPECIES: hypothetical protein [Kocuria]|jgi:Mn2+/Fe2+ NRAMP family transporter|uniref:hypothetical protein n=1 Tax=Kocuria TaxID=57493 RepID=UPI00203FB833|nr:MULTISPECIES: hypothetical protein [Kocuria]MCM3689465.1 hypothetical protein [Kocuria rosea]
MMVALGLVLMVLAVAVVLATARREVLMEADRLTAGTVASTMAVVAAGIVLFITGAAIAGMSVLLTLGLSLRP